MLPGPGGGSQDIATLSVRKENKKALHTVDMHLMSWIGIQLKASHAQSHTCVHVHAE